MAEMIDVLVTRPAPFWLPSVAERDPKTKLKIRSIAGKLLLRPGANRIPRSRWELALQHPTVAAHHAAGTLKTDATAREVADSTHTPDAMTGLSAMTVEKSKPWILAAEDIDLLSRWRTSEVKGKARAGILDLIDERTEELEEE